MRSNALEPKSSDMNNNTHANQVLKFYKSEIIYLFISLHVIPHVEEFRFIPSPCRK